MKKWRTNPSCATAARINTTRIRAELAPAKSPREKHSCSVDERFTVVWVEWRAEQPCIPTENEMDAAEGVNPIDMAKARCRNKGGIAAA